MYTPEHFNQVDLAATHALMRANPFALLVTYGPGGMIGSHVPTVFKVDETAPLGRIECHLARPNPQWREIDPAIEALCVFQGADAYVRPGWYPSKAEHGKAVPTWNYASVHCYGRLEIVTDPEWLRRHVSELSDLNEAGYEHPWSTQEAPEAYLAMMLRGIIGFSLTISRIDSKAKMSQNREARDRAGVVDGLTRRAQRRDLETAKSIKP